MTDRPIQKTTDRERWEAEVDRDLLRIFAITGGIFACGLGVFTLIMWWVRS